MKSLPIFIFLIISNFSFAQFKFGAGLGYLENGNQFSLQAKTAVGITNELMLGGSYNYYLSSANQYDVNVDAMWRIIDINRTVYIYPFGGLHFIKPNNTRIDIGINLGLFSYFPITEKLELYIEPKYILGSARSFSLSAGVFFF